MIQKQKREKEKMQHAIKSIKPKLDMIKEWITEEKKSSLAQDRKKVS